MIFEGRLTETLVQVGQGCDPHRTPALSRTLHSARPVRTAPHIMRSRSGRHQQCPLHNHESRSRKLRPRPTFRRPKEPVAADIRDTLDGPERVLDNNPRRLVARHGHDSTRIDLDHGVSSVAHCRPHVSRRPGHSGSPVVTGHHPWCCSLRRSKRSGGDSGRPGSRD